MTTKILHSIYGRVFGLSRHMRIVSNLKGDLNQVHGGIVYSNTAASGPISNSAAETLFDTNFAIPANSLVAGMVIKVRFQLKITAAHSTDTLTVKLYLGGLSGTAILTGAATDASANDIIEGEATIIIRSVGANGTFVAVGSFTKVEAASGTATRVSANTDSTAIDTTAAQTIGISATWSVADVGNSVRADIVAIEII